MTVQIIYTRSELSPHAATAIYDKMLQLLRYWHQITSVRVSSQTDNHTSTPWI